MTKTIKLAAMLSLFAAPALADEFTPAMQDYLDGSISSWAQSDVLVAAINAQNEMTAGYDQARIDELDQAWRAEVGMSDTPTISPVIANAAAKKLKSAPILAAS